MAEQLGSLAERWRAAESRLYPIVFVDPPKYELYLRLVRAVADDLKDRSTAEQLAEAYAGGSRLLADAVDRLSVAGSPIDKELVLDAAFQARYRELRAERQQAEAKQRIAAAGGEPQWVVLAETGTARPLPAPGYERLEMHVPDGTGLHTFVEHDPSTYTPRYGIELLRLDPSTGEYLASDGSPYREEFGDPDEWMRAVEHVRRADDPWTDPKPA